MNSSILTLPFRIVLGIVKFFLYPWYVRWIFRLPWVAYAGLAAWAGYTAYQEYENYRFNVFEAGYQISEGVPDPTPLSKWNAASDVHGNDEVHVSGLYFEALPSGAFEAVSVRRSFVLLADDQGREVKAALVVDPDDLLRLQRMLEAQGNSDRIAVNVNGTVNRSTSWANEIDTELSRLNIPGAPDLVVIEPFIESRADALRENAEDSFANVTVFGVLAGLLGFLGVGRFLSGRGARLAASAHQSQKSGREVQAEKQAAQAAQNVGLPDQAPEASPWGTFQPQAREAETPAQAKASRAKPKREADVVTPTEPQYKSVFPGGGSAFRFKTADQIIKQTFGARSGLKSSAEPIKSSKGEE